MASASLLPRVLHLIHSEQRRGAEVFAAQLAACIEANGLFKNRLCTLYSGGGEELPVGDVPLDDLGGHPGLLDTLGLDPFLVAKLCRAMREFSPDIVIAHGSDTLKYTAAASYFHRGAVNIYRNIGTASAWASSRIRSNVNRLCLSRFDLVVSVSEVTRLDFIKNYHLAEHQVKYIPNGVDGHEFDLMDHESARREVRRELGLSSGEKVILAIGRLSPEKGHAGLLDVMDGLRRAVPQVRLIMVGTGPLQEALEEQVRTLGLGDSVRFLGLRKDVFRVMAACDVLALPSKTEGMPTVLVEAGFAGLPAVAFDVGGVAEVLEDGTTGVLLPPEDYRAMAEVLGDLLKDPGQRQRMGQRAWSWSREQFDVRSLAQDYEDLFLRLLDTAKGRVKWQTARR